MASIKQAIELEDKFTRTIDNIINSVNLVISAMENAQESVDGAFDPAMVTAAKNAIDDATMAAQQMAEAVSNIPEVPQVSTASASVPTPASAPVRMPAAWQTDSIKVFTDTGIDRFRQEIQSADEMLRTLSETQLNIAAQSEQTSVFPKTMTADMQKMQSRITFIQQRIQAIQSNPMTMGLPSANAELEQLRSKLVQAVQQQKTLNRAVDSMDIETANAAYLQLSQTVGSAEVQIRDNTAKQEEFNNAVRDGVGHSDKLFGKIKSLVAAYASVRTIGKLFTLSDEITQTTARLELMNDGAQTTEELFNMTFEAAQRSRGSLQSMADVVARFGNNAKSAFTSNREVIAFSELIQKQMTIAGAGTQEANNAMLQLSQAMGSGVLRGDELNSIFEQAPNLIQSIADYLNVPIGSIREMAQEGQLTADVVKAAVFASADDINDKFNAMPKTWGQIWQSIQNKAIIAFQPVLDRLSELANSEKFQTFADNAVNALPYVAEFVLWIIDGVINIANAIAENWDKIAPIISMAAAVFGVLAIAIGGAKIAQALFNTELFGCPIIWIIAAVMLLIVIIYKVVEAVNKATGQTNSALGIIMGSLSTVGAIVYNLFLGIMESVFKFIEKTLNPLIIFANFIGNLFNDPVGAIIKLFSDLADGVLQNLQHIASALDFVFGSNMADTIQGWRDDLAVNTEIAMKKYGNGQYEEIMSKLDLSAEGLGFERLDYYDAYSAGYQFGEGVDNMIKGFDLKSMLSETGFGYDGLGGIIEGIADDTGDIKSSLDISQEDLKYLRDIAEQETINRFTTAEIHIDMSGMSNTVNNGSDLDGFISELTDEVTEAMFISAEGVHA